MVRELPRRAHDLTRREVRDSQRWRLLEAITEAVANLGYATATVADVIEVANVSRKTFYEHFHDKEDCFLAAYDFLSDRLMTSLIAVGDRHPAGAARRRAQIKGYLAALAAEPTIARVFMVDVLGAGAAALRRRERVTASCGLTILGPDVGDVLRAAIVGGVNNVVASALLRGEAARLPDLADPLCNFVETAIRSSARRKR